MTGRAGRIAGARLPGARRAVRPRPATSGHGGASTGSDDARDGAAGRRDRAGDEGAGRRFAPAVLAAPGYPRLWRAGLLYYHAYWFEIVATGWVVLTLTGSPFAVGLVGFCRTLPMLALGLVLGALADRLREATLLLAVQAAGALAAAALAALFLLGRAPLPALCLLVGLLGCGWACDFSARRALVAQLHGPERVANALSLESMTMLGSKIAATALAGLLLALGGPRLAYGWLALVYLAGVGAALAVRRGDPPRRRAWRPPASR